MIMLDNTVVNVALPSIATDLKISISELEWIVTGYALVFAALLITGGKLADMYGRRKIFVIGLTIFSLSSLACGLAPNAGFLIGARGVQGVGAALMNPATLSIIPRPSAATAPTRRSASGRRPAMALAIGPLGGLIVDISAGTDFFINVPIAPGSSCRSS